MNVVSIDLVFQIWIVNGILSDSYVESLDKKLAVNAPVWMLVLTLTYSTRCQLS